MAAAITTTATSLEGQALEVLTALQIAEAAVTDGENRVTIGLDVEAGQVDLNVSLPATFASTGASLSMTATEYLS